MLAYYIKMDYSSRYGEGTQPPNTRPHNTSLASEIVPASDLNLPYQTEPTRPSNPAVAKILKEAYKRTEGDREPNTALQAMEVGEGGSFFGDLWSGIKDVATTAAPFLPLIL
jgi:hypothetical protein